jgi:hypothetical protein
MSNNSLLRSFQVQYKPQIIFVGIIALILASANIIILNKLKGWHKRILQNQRINSGRMREIELQLGNMSRSWLTYAIDRWHEKFGDKKPTECDAQIWQMLKLILISDLDDSLLNKIDTLQKRIVIAVKHSFRKEYERPSSQKHYPCILRTLMVLWALVAGAAMFVIVANKIDKCWGIIAGVIVTIITFILADSDFRKNLFTFIKKLILTIKKIFDC